MLPPEKIKEDVPFQPAYPYTTWPQRHSTWPCTSGAGGDRTHPRPDLAVPAAPVRRRPCFPQYPRALGWRVDQTHKETETSTPGHERKRARKQPGWSSRSIHHDSSYGQSHAAFQDIISSWAWSAVCFGGCVDELWTLHYLLRVKRQLTINLGPLIKGSSHGDREQVWGAHYILRRVCARGGHCV